VESQVLTLRSQTVVELENKAARNAQRLGQLQAELALEREEHEASSKAIQEAIMGTLHALADHKEEVKRRLGALRVLGGVWAGGGGGGDGWMGLEESGRSSSFCVCPFFPSIIPTMQASSGSTASRSATSSSRSPRPLPTPSRSPSPSRREQSDQTSFMMDGGGGRGGDVRYVYMKLTDNTRKGTGRGWVDAKGVGRRGFD
jgi:hypothetical protein